MSVLSPAVFCIYYITRGILQENRQELVVFVLSVLVVMIRSVVNFSVVDSKGKQELLVGPCLMTQEQITHKYCCSGAHSEQHIVCFHDLV